MLLLINNIFRFIQAGSEVSGLMGQMPSRLGYQPTMGTELSALEERIANTDAGAITSIQAVYVPADDFTGPAAVHTFSHISASLVLLRKRASEGLFPAIDPLQSSSKMATAGIVGERHYRLAQDIRRTLAQYGELTDRGLVGQFNEVVADYAIETLGALPGTPQVWAVGERVHSRLQDAGLALMGYFTVPNSVQAITPLVRQIQIDTEAHRAKGAYSRVYVFHNRPQSRALYGPVNQRLLPLDAEWQQDLATVRWPTRNLPEVMRGGTATLRALIREYHFISLFRACAESLASENTSRLAAMERADKNINELLENLRGTFHRLRQSGIDAELFDVISGFEALVGPR